MQTETFPKIRKTKPLNVRNQFGRFAKGRGGPCDACEALAALRVTVATSWFPNEDIAYSLCAAHGERAQRGEWRRLFVEVALHQAAFNDGQ